MLNELSYQLPHQLGSTNVSVLPPRNLGGDLIAFFKTKFQPGELGFYRTQKQLPFIVSPLWAGNAHTLPELILPAVQLEAGAQSWWATQSVQSRAAAINCSKSHMLPAGPMLPLPLKEVTSWTDIMIISFRLLEKYSLLGASKERARPYLVILISRLTHLRQGKDLGKKIFAFSWDSCVFSHVSKAILGAGRVVRLLIKFLIEKFLEGSTPWIMEYLSLLASSLKCGAPRLYISCTNAGLFRRALCWDLLKCWSPFWWKGTRQNSSAHWIEFTEWNIHMSVGTGFGVIFQLDGIFFSASSPSECSVGPP